MYIILLLNIAHNFILNVKGFLSPFLFLSFYIDFSYNIPGSRISGGEVICEYLPPIPIQGTGFHRFVFCLIKQSGELDFRSDLVIRKPR